VKKGNRILAIGLAVISLCTGFWVAWAENKSEPAQKETTFMRTKLLHAQKVLEGLLTEDFEMIVTHAQKMSLLTQGLGWQVLQGQEYTQRSTAFRRSVDQLTEAAKKKNPDGVSLAYIDVTIQCFQCHQYVRKMRHTHLGPLKRSLNLSGFVAARSDPEL
jgi:hypothetical protein